MTVEDILKTVRNGGDLALKDFSEKFDGFSPEQIRVTQDEIDKSGQLLSTESKNAIDEARKAIHMFHEAQLQPDLIVNTLPGVECRMVSRAIPSVGLYVPGGTAPLVSTVLMLCIPAQIAGCQRIVLCSPPPISPSILYAASVCGIDEIYQVGGAQAVAAMAFGTESISKIEKIFGPGNAYVTEAKRQVRSMSDGPGIDMIAGPTELMIIADDSSNPSFIAADLLGQSEHGIDSQVVLVTVSDTLGDRVRAEIESQLPRLSRRDIVSTSLESSISISCDSIEDAIQVANRYAPEHLSISVDEPQSVVDKIQNAGSIFAGHWSPEAVGDYASGTNHVLPTNGSAVRTSGLSLRDFQKTITVQHVSPSGMRLLGPTVLELARLEELDGHAASVSIRLDELTKQTNGASKS